MSIAGIVTNAGTINAVVNGKSYVVPKDHRNYAAVKEAFNNRDATAFVAAADLAAKINAATVVQTAGKVRVEGGVVYYLNTPLHNVVTERILLQLQEGFNIDPMVKFLENLMNNPSRRAVMELYKFLERQGLPITEDGCFLGYKRVRDDFTDNHTGTVRNQVGDAPEMPRNMVDDEWRTLCSSGFHVGSIEYVRNFHGGTGHVMIVKVNPADVVSVPPGEETKLRTCKYVVVGEYDRMLVDPLPGSVYTADGQRATPPAAETVSDGTTGQDRDNYTDTQDRDNYTDDEDDDDTDDDEFDDEDEEFEDDDQDDEEDDDDDQDDDDTEDAEGELDLTGKLLLELARKMDQPFDREALVREAGKADDAPNAALHNHEVREAVYRLIDVGLLVPAGGGKYTTK